MSVGIAESSLESNQAGTLEVSVFMCQENCIVTAQAAATSVRQCLSFSGCPTESFLLYTKQWATEKEVKWTLKRT